MVEPERPALGWQSFLVTTFRQGFDLYEQAVDAGYQVEPLSNIEPHNRLPDIVYAARGELQRTVWIPLHEGARLWLNLNAPAPDPDGNQTEA